MGTARHFASAQTRTADPRWRKANARVGMVNSLNPEWRAARAAEWKARWADPAFREKMHAIHRSPEYRAKCKAAVIKSYSKPGRRKRQIEALHRMRRSPDYRRRLSAGARKSWESPSAKQIEMIRKNGYGKHGKVILSKNRGSPCYDSLLERDWFHKLERAPSVLTFRVKPFWISYHYGDIVRRYEPDVMIVFQSGRRELWEIKPDGKYYRTAKERSKWDAARTWCDDRGIVFRVVGYNELKMKGMPS